MHGSVTCRGQQLVPEDDSPDARNIAISTETAAEVRKSLNVMLNRSIIDFLVRYFVTKVNWFVSLLQIGFRRY